MTAMLAIVSMPIPKFWPRFPRNKDKTGKKKNRKIQGSIVRGEKKAFAELKTANRAIFVFSPELRASRLKLMKENTDARVPPSGSLLVLQAVTSKVVGK